jgi:serine/threonine protein kinase/Tfp pilus assembly protein PilF
MNEADQVTFMCLDQRRHWHRGDRILVEAYLAKQPRPLADPDAILDLIYNEIVLREAAGEAPHLEEYLTRFPQFATELRRQFEIHGALQEGDLVPESEADEPALPSGEYDSGSTDVRLPGYRIVRELGRGGMGVVYEAHQIHLKRSVALKMILAGAYASPKELARFRVEAEAVARLRHPHIVQIHEVGEYKGFPYFSLELIEGQSLDKEIGGRPQPPRESAQLVETLAHAIHHAHQHHVIHRDLKPANILLQKKSEIRNSKSENEETGSSSDFGFRISNFDPKITDFGLAKLLDTDNGATPTQALIGTPNYMAPEQAEGKSRDIGPRADVYALGAILYELLTGRPPFHGDSAMDTIWQVRNQPPTPPSRLGAGVPRDLETICLKCLDKEPRRRYAAASELADDLRRFLEGRPIQARPARPWQRLWKWARRRPAAATLAAASVLALMSAVALFPIYRQIAHQAALRSIDEKYREFEQKSNDALFRAMISPIQGTLFNGDDLVTNAAASEQSARQALALASNLLGGNASGPQNQTGEFREAEIQSMRYTLLLVLADALAPQPHSDGNDSGSYREALRILDSGQELGFDTIAYHLHRSRYLLKLGQHEEADKEDERAKALRPQNALDYFLIGDERYRRGEVTAAITAFNEALACQPSHFWAQFYLAVCQLRVEDWKTAKAHLNACLVQQPRFVWIYVLRAFTNEKLEALESAEADVQKALDLDPNEDARYTLLLERGNLFFGQHHFESAADDFQAAIALKPRQYAASLNLARVYFAQARFIEATSAMHRAMSLNPAPLAMFGLQIERSRAFYTAKKYEDAVEACDEALKIFPAAPLPHEIRAFALLELERYAEALRALDQRLKSDEPLKKDGAGPEVFRARGRALMKLGRYSEAVDDFTRALVGGSSTDTYAERGWANFFSDAWKLAVRDFEEAIRREPENREAYVGRGLSKVMLGQYQEAVADAERALSRGPDTPETLHNIACIFAQAASKAEAVDSANSAPALTVRYQNRALEALRQALSRVPAEKRVNFWRNKVSPDRWLDPIRRSVGFRELERGLFGQNASP